MINHESAAYKAGEELAIKRIADVITEYDKTLVDSLSDEQWDEWVVKDENPTVHDVDGLILEDYTNGNAKIQIYDDGTRIIDFPDSGIKLEWPLNIDIRVSTRCSMGFNPKTQKSICDFCHESARTDGEECDYQLLLDKLAESQLPRGIELAIGANAVTVDLIEFLDVCKERGYICSITVNQAHVKKYANQLQYLIETNKIKGLGVSYRSHLKFDIPQFILDYPNTVFHVIVGIDDFDDIINLSKHGVKKILLLGEKDFGFNINKVDINSPSHKKWHDQLIEILTGRIYSIISFDNLAVQQLDVKRYLSDDQWQTFYQGEHSMYINAVMGYYADSSRSFNKENWNQVDLRTFFKYHKKDNKEN